MGTKNSIEGNRNNTPIKRYAFGWVAVLVGRDQSIQPQEKALIVRRLSGMIANKEWNDIVTLGGIEIAESIVVKLGSGGENIKPLQDAIQLHKEHQYNTALRKSIDEHRGIKDYSSEDFNYKYIPLLERVAEGTVGEQKPDLGLKKKTITKPSGVYSWTIEDGVFNRKILVLKAIGGNITIDTKLTSVFRSYEEEINGVKKIVIEYLPKQTEDETN